MSIIGSKHVSLSPALGYPISKCKRGVVTADLRQKKRCTLRDIHDYVGFIKSKKKHPAGQGSDFQGQEMSRVASNYTKGMGRLNVGIYKLDISPRLG